MQQQTMDERQVHRWKARLRKRRSKSHSSQHIRELNLVAMMDMLTVIVIFLLKSYSVSAMAIPTGGGLNVPRSSNTMQPQEAVKLIITREDAGKPGSIAVDDKPIVYQGTSTPLALDGAKMAEFEKMARDRKFLLPDLIAALKVKAEASREISRLNPESKFEGKILVVADKELPYWLLTQVLFTAAEAGFDQYSLVAVRTKQE